MPYVQNTAVEAVEKPREMQLFELLEEQDAIIREALRIAREITASLTGEAFVPFGGEGMEGLLPLAVNNRAGLLAVLEEIGTIRRKLGAPRHE